MIGHYFPDFRYGIFAGLTNTFLNLGGQNGGWVLMQHNKHDTTYKCKNIFNKSREAAWTEGVRGSPLQYAAQPSSTYARTTY